MKNDVIDLFAEPVTFNHLNSSCPERSPRQFHFKGFPETLFEIYDDNTFGVNSLSININSRTSDVIIQDVMMWGNVTIGLSKNGVYFDAEQINMGNGIGYEAQLTLLSSDSKVVLGVPERE